MALPHTPYVKDVRNFYDGTGSSWVYITGTKQSKPRKSVLPYYAKHLVTLSAKLNGFDTVGVYGGFANAGTGKSPAAYSAFIADRNTKYVVDAKNAALSKFKEKMSDSSMWAVNLVEAQKSLDMIAARGYQLLNFVRALKRGDIVKAGRILETPSTKPVKRSTKGAAKTFADQFLEMHFGWTPLVQDIHNACSFLSQPLKTSRVRGKKTVLDTHVYNASSQMTSPCGYVNNSYRGAHEISTRVLIQADVAITNPNLFLAEQMGLINPATVIWEIVPWSFVVDWFVNIGDFLSNYTAFYGLQINNPFWTYKMTDVCTFTSSEPQCVKIEPSPPWPGPYYYRSAYGKEIVSRAVTCERIMGLPAYTLTTKSWSTSPKRAITAISLLIQQMR